MDKRFFTLREANALIPFLTDRLRDLRGVYRGLKKLGDQKTPGLQEVILRGGIPVSEGYFKMLGRLQAITSDIGSQGCHIKDLDQGLVDFPTIWEGREVYLCWKFGEPEVVFWHELDAGFGGRQPLKTSPQ